MIPCIKKKETACFLHQIHAKTEGWQHNDV